MTSVAEIFKSMEYGPAPEGDHQARQWLGKFEKVFGHFINGEWTEPGATFDVINPANRELLARVVGQLDVDVELSGGIRDDGSLTAALATGCRRVNLGTAALESPEWCAQAIAQ